MTIATNSKRIRANLMVVLICSWSQAAMTAYSFFDGDLPGHTADTLQQASEHETAVPNQSYRAPQPLPQNPPLLCQQPLSSIQFVGTHQLPANLLQNLAQPFIGRPISQIHLPALSQSLQQQVQTYDRGRHQIGQVTPDCRARALLVNISPTRQIARTRPNPQPSNVENFFHFTGSHSDHIPITQLTKAVTPFIHQSITTANADTFARHVQAELKLAGYRDIIVSVLSLANVDGRIELAINKANIFNNDTLASARTTPQKNIEPIQWNQFLQEQDDFAEPAVTAPVLTPTPQDIAPPNIIRNDIPAATADLLKPTPPAAIAQHTGSQNIHIKHVSFIGLPSSVRQPVQQVIAPYIGQILSRDQLNDLSHAAEETMRNLGHINAQVWVPPQPFSKGVLKLAVTNGKVADPSLRFAATTTPFDNALQALVETSLSPQDTPNGDRKRTDPDSIAGAQVNSVKFTGVPKTVADQLLSTVAGDTSKFWDAQNLYQVIDQVENKLLDLGYPSAFVTIPPQTLTDYALEINIALDEDAVNVAHYGNDTPAVGTTEHAHTTLGQVLFRGIEGHTQHALEELVSPYLGSVIDHYKLTSLADELTHTLHANGHNQARVRLVEPTQTYTTAIYAVEGVLTADNSDHGNLIRDFTESADLSLNPEHGDLRPELTEATTANDYEPHQPSAPATITSPIQTTARDSYRHEAILVSTQKIDDVFSREFGALPVKGFEFIGNRSIPEQDLQTIVTPFRNIDLDPYKMQQCVKAIESFLQNQGYILASALILDQEFDNNIIEIIIQEGRLRDVKFDWHKDTVPNQRQMDLVTKHVTPGAIINRALVRHVLNIFDSSLGIVAKPSFTRLNEDGEYTMHLNLKGG